MPLPTVRAEYRGGQSPVVCAVRRATRAISNCQNGDALPTRRQRSTKPRAARSGTHRSADTAATPIRSMLTAVGNAERGRRRAC